MKSPNEIEIGVIGLGTMGRNILLNIADHGFSVIGHDLDPDKVKLTQNEKKAAGHFEATQDEETFLARLKRPRALILLVPAGKPVDQVLMGLTPLLAKGDLVIDAGNSHFTDTDLREKSLKEKGIFFFGMGVSGGEAGARNGPSMMPGGDKAAYERVRPVFEAIAAQVKGKPCVTYLGPTSSGHYVKMIHNGIEYALMQLIAETYFLMKTALELTDDECHEVYQEWNQSELSSYLLEITAKIFLKNDDSSQKRLIDVILDVAKQKGTGKWTCQDAMELQVPLPTIDAAVGARDLSTFDADRKTASMRLKGSKVHSKIERDPFIQQLRNAYYASSIITFAQGMVLAQKASQVYRYDLNLESIARIWRGGCIIRAELLEPIMSAYRETPELSNLLLNSELASEVEKRQDDLRSIIQTSARNGYPVPAFMASLAYYDGLRSSWLPANLTQAQRDFFGAHTYERVDKPGTFHSEWEKK
jgi:6-phosphogluconate dehydrogenase